MAAFAIVGIIGLAAWHQGSVVGLLFKGCDSFCYSEMAASIRDAREADLPVDYFLRDDQTKFLIQKFKASGLPEGDWGEAIAPHGYHYFHIPSQVGPQYPPGVPWELSFFRPIGAIHDLNRMSICFIAVIGLGLACWCAHRGLPLSILIVAMATYAYLAIFTWVGLASFSINATILPLFAGIILAWFAREQTRGVPAGLLAFFAGVGVGLAMDDRVASLLLLPSMMLFFLPRKWSLMAAYLAGIALGDIVPLLLHDKLITGSIFATTYNTDGARQSVENIWTNLLFYMRMWQQNSSAHVIILTVALLALVVLVRSSSRLPEGHWRQWSWNRAGFILTPPVTFAVAAAYFLTQTWRQGYYLTPSMLTVALILALLFVSLEKEWREVVPEASRWRWPSWAAIGLAMCGLTAAFYANRYDLEDGVKDVLGSRPEVVVPFILPAPMQEKNAWIWADDLSGTIRLETGHPAFKVGHGSLEARRLIYDWVRARGESQYFVEDGETMRGMIDESHRLGWKTTLVGYVLDNPCYRMTRAP